MTITIKIDTKNAAFHNEDADEGDRYAQEDAKDREVGRILLKWAQRIPEDGYGATLHDYNGNRVGQVTIKGR